MKLSVVSLCAAHLGLAAILAADPASQTTTPEPRQFSANPRSLRIVVMDPLAGPLACACVKGYAQRQYDRLALFLEERLNQPVEIAFAESLNQRAIRANLDRVGLVIGKQSVVEYDAARLGLPIEPIALLTDKTGSTRQHGLFVVRSNDLATSIADLRGRSVLFGPEDSEEKHQAAIAALKQHRIPTPAKPPTSKGCTDAAMDLLDGKADAAVISSYAAPLLEGCGTVDKGELRVVGKTGTVPFIYAFASAKLGAGAKAALQAALCDMGTDASLLEAMESRHGFIPYRGPVAGEAALKTWSDWRGTRRQAITSAMPRQLPEKPVFLWKKPLTGLGLSGIAAAEKAIVVADKSPDEAKDVWRCLKADTGEELWNLQYSTPKELDFSNSPRATPVIHGHWVYLLGAFGDLHCVELSSGKVVWATNIVQQFGARLPTWGLSATPLVFGDLLLINPGASNAALAALDLAQGQPVWQSPGNPAAYASFIVATLGGREQLVGYDSISLGGWSPQTGERLWQVLPKEEGDFNVPTPIIDKGRLLVSTENNGTRAYVFEASGGGSVSPKLAASFPKLNPDSLTPVIIDGTLWGAANGTLYCLDTENGLKPLWTMNERALEDYASLIAGNGRILVLTQAGELILVQASREKSRVVSRLRIFDDPKTEIWSHPALVGNRFYVRNQDSVVCLLF